MVVVGRLIVKIRTTAELISAPANRSDRELAPTHLVRGDVNKCDII